MFPRDQRVIAFSAFDVRDLSDNDYVEVSPLTGVRKVVTSAL